MKVVRINKTDMYVHDSIFNLWKIIRILSSAQYTILQNKAEKKYIVLYDEIKYITRNKSAGSCRDLNNPFVNRLSFNSDREGARLMKLAEQAFLYQTFQTPIRGINILDLVFINNIDLIHTYEVSDPLANSDHNIVESS